MSKNKLPAHTVLVNECSKAVLALKSGNITFPDKCFLITTAINQRTPLALITLMALPKILGEIPIPLDDRQDVVETLRQLKKECSLEHQEALFPEKLFKKILS